MFQRKYSSKFIGNCLLRLKFVHALCEILKISKYRIIYMLRKFTIEALRPGMFVSGVPSSVLDTPFLYSTEGMLSTQDDISKIVALGFKEAVVDLNRSYKEWASLYPTEGSEEFILSAPQRPPTPVPLEPTTSLEEELPRAAELYNRALLTAQHVMRQFKDHEELDVQAGSEVVEGIMGSLLRNVNALQAMSRLHTQDDYTFSHCVNVAILIVMFARHLGDSEESMFEAGMAGFFHDLGKFRMPAKILRAPRRLTPEEFAVMREHPKIGWEYLGKIPEISDTVRLTALEHHERVNGSGYPDGKTGEQISRLGKMAAILDVYDALSSRRVYKEPIKPHRVLGMLYGMRGQEIDAELTEHFIRCVGIYPAGSLVRLTTDELGVVTRVNHTAPLRPTVLIVRDPWGNRVNPVSIDLSRAPDIAISACLEDGTHGIQPANILREYMRTA